MRRSERDITLTIPKNVTTIELEAFRYCAGLSAINVHPDNANYSSVDGVLYNKEQTTVILCPEGKTGAITLPKSIKTIRDEAFHNCTGLNSIILPEILTTIGDKTTPGTIIARKQKDSRKFGLTIASGDGFPGITVDLRPGRFESPKSRQPCPPGDSKPGITATDCPGRKSTIIPGKPSPRGESLSHDLSLFF